MPDNKELFGSNLKDREKVVLGRTIVEGLTSGRFTFTNPLATEGGDYNQTKGDYSQSGGGTHNQGEGGYTQSKLERNLGDLRINVTDLAEIMGSIDTIAGP